MNFQIRNISNNPRNKSNYSSSSSDDEDIYEFLKIEISKSEFENLSKTIDRPYNPIELIKKILDGNSGKMMNYYMNLPIFFSAEEYGDNVLSFKKNVDFLLTLPNSYLPLMEKPPHSNSPISAPLYMNEIEMNKFCKPVSITGPHYGREKYGLSFKYDLLKKKDIQSNFVYHQRLFFDKILKERLTNKAAYGKDAEYELPLTLYEPNTLLRRFCDVFTFLAIGFEEIFTKNEYDEEYIIRKFFSSLLAGFHKPIASQGIPLKPLIGETYEVDSKNSDLKLFAEVKNDNPIHIVYNLRWKGRKVCLDGSVLMKSDFNETTDEIRTKMGGINTLRLFYDDLNKYKIFSFNLPLRCTFKGIIDPILDKDQRHMSVDSFIYFKGETKSAIIGLNCMSHKYIFNAFYGMIIKSILNYKQLENGHSFFGVIFHNSGLTLENSKDGNVLQAFIINTSRRIESIEKLLDEKSKWDKMNMEIKNPRSLNVNGIEIKILDEKERIKNEMQDPRYKNISWEDFLLQDIKGKGNFSNIDKNALLKIDPNQLVYEERKNNRGDDQYDIQNKSDYKRDNEAELFKINKGKKEIVKLDREDDKQKKRERRNIYPFKIYYRLFKKTIVAISKFASSKTFISNFNMHFIYKLYIGSWAFLNFFEIAYQGNEMNEFYIKFKMGQVNARPISEFNSKSGLNIKFEDNNFFMKYKSLFGKLWKPIKNPLLTDTRYREDLLWLIRFYEIVEKYPENENDSEKLDAYEKIRLESFLNAGKWKEILEAYTYVNISRKINRNDVVGISDK